MSQLVSFEEDIEYALDQPSTQKSFESNYNTHNIIINSQPSGAEIYLNGRNTGQLTPGRLAVPADQAFTVGLRKDGFINYKADTKSKGNGSTQSFTMQKLNIGRLDILAKNKNTIIYISGKRLRERPPIYNYRVPSSRKIKIRAVDKVKRLYSERMVSVKPNAKIQINMVPNKPL